MGDNDEWKNMFQELTGYEKKNISLRINGIPASPMQIVQLTLDNDEIIECAILTVYEAAGKEYIALLPLDENLEPNEAGDVYLYQYNETEDGEPDLGNIEDDDEYEIAADAFDEWMDSQEFDESDVEE